MFWNKKSAKEDERRWKLSGPKEIPGVVQNHLVGDRRMDPELVKLLKALVFKNEAVETGLNIRVFDPSEASARKAAVKDYTSLDECRDLIIYEGWFDERSKQVKLEEMKKVNWDVPIFTQGEIQQKIEVLKEPGEKVFFYMARGSGQGGPLGMGAAVIEFNPKYPDKKQKKYIIYAADVVDMQPVDTGQKLFDSDKPKDIARWIKDAHHKRMY